MVSEASVSYQGFRSLECDDDVQMDGVLVG